MELIEKVKVFKTKEGQFIPIADLTDEQLAAYKQFISERINQVCHKIGKLEKQIKYYESKNDIYGTLWDDFIAEEEDRRLRRENLQSRPADRQGTAQRVGTPKKKLIFRVNKAQDRGEGMPLSKTSDAS